MPKAGYKSVIKNYWLSVIAYRSLSYSDGDIIVQIGMMSTGNLGGVELVRWRVKGSDSIKVMPIFNSRGGFIPTGHQNPPRLPDYESIVMSYKTDLLNTKDNQ